MYMVVELVHLNGLNAGKPWMSAYMERPSLTSWGWIVDSLQRECECDAEEISIIEFGADDGSDVVAVRGKPLAKIVQRPFGTLPTGARVN